MDYIAIDIFNLLFNFGMFLLMLIGLLVTIVVHINKKK